MREIKVTVTVPADKIDEVLPLVSKFWQPKPRDIEFTKMAGAALTLEYVLDSNELGVMAEKGPAIFEALTKLIDDVEALDIDVKTEGTLAQSITDAENILYALQD